MRKNYEKAIKLIDGMLMKKMFMNEPQVFHYKFVVTLIQWMDRHVSREDLEKVMTESIS